jgi:ribonuclease P/MRP protein subunit POP3
VEPSKGKRAKKRKRKEAKLAEATSKPPVPEISSFVVVGLNSITRYLESSSQASKPKQSMEGATNETSTREPAMEENSNDAKVSRILDKPQNSTHFSAIFVLRSSQPSILHSHLPQLIATASKARPDLPATGLVQLPKNCDARLCQALELSRVSFIGLLEGAPHSKALVDLVRDCVSEVEIPWLQEVKKANYLPVKINVIETLAPVVKEKEKKGS